MKKMNKTPLAKAMGTLMLSGLAANVSADANPFAMTELSTAYMQVAVDLNNKVSEGGCGSNKGAAATTANPGTKKAEGNCGEGKCGAMMSGGKMKPGMENSCGSMMKNKEGTCGMMGMNQDNAGKAKQEAAGKSAEHNCGAMMNGAKGGEAKGGEATCGAMMKGGEGSCGSKVDAGKAAGK